MPSLVVGSRAPWVEVADLGDELSLFDGRTGQALALNRTAADVWLLADGVTLVEEVIAVLAAAYGQDAAAISDQVVATLEALERAGVLVAP